MFPVLNPYLSMPAQDIVRQYLRIRRMQLCLLYGSFALVILGPALITAAAGAMNVVSALVLAGFAALFLFLIARFKRKLFPQNLTLIREVLTDACDPARYRDVIQDICRCDRSYADVFSAPLELADAEAALGDEASAAARLYALRFEDKRDAASEARRLELLAWCCAQTGDAAGFAGARDAMDALAANGPFAVRAEAHAAAGRIALYGAARGMCAAPQDGPNAPCPDGLRPLYALRVRYCLAEVLASRGRTQEALRCLQPVIDHGRGLALTARAGSLAARLEQDAQPQEKRAPDRNTH